MSTETIQAGNIADQPALSESVDLSRFKPVQEIGDNYLVSPKGEIYSLPRHRTKGGLLNISLWSGYPSVGLIVKGVKTRKLIHRLIAIAFIPNPENKPHINHKNGIKTDHRIENLEWCTRSENQSHRYSVLGQITPNRKFSKTQIMKILGDNKTSRTKIASKYGVSRDCIDRIKTGKNYKQYYREFIAELSKPLKP